MNDDIGPMLGEWPYKEDEDILARRIVGPNGESRIQVRLELGLLEMWTSGRPDGWRPEGYESLLDLHRDRLGEVAADDGKSLDHGACGALQREAMQYYQRRLAYLRIGEFAAAAADAEHNLAIMDLLRDHAADKSDWLRSEQFRTFVLSHWTRARMLEALARSDLHGAVTALDEGIEAIEHTFRDEYRRPDLMPKSEELKALVELRGVLLRSNTPPAPTLPGEAERLDHELARAVQAEDFERAARLRDALTRLRGGATGGEA